MRMPMLHDVARREVAIRKAVYERKVAEGRMSEENKQFQIQAMEEITGLLEALSHKFVTEGEALNHIQAL